MMRQAASVALLLLFAGGSVVAADTPSGKAIFERNCAACHAPGPGHPGTQRLAQLRGAAQSALEQRTDLDPAYVRIVVRQGLVEMPPWRPTELGDAELHELADYLGRGRK
jgi:mono/diheme cytochrome c family protein